MRAVIILLHTKAHLLSGTGVSPAAPQDLHESHANGVSYGFYHFDFCSTVLLLDKGRTAHKVRREEKQRTFSFSPSF